MDSKAKVANKIKHQIVKFSGIILKPFPKTKRRLIKEITYGIQASNRNWHNHPRGVEIPASFR